MSEHEERYKDEWGNIICHNCKDFCYPDGKGVYEVDKEGKELPIKCVYCGYHIDDEERYYIDRNGNYVCEICADYDDFYGDEELVEVRPKSEEDILEYYTEQEKRGMHRYG
jgi:hypothetical protein